MTGSGSREQYLRKHWFKIRTKDHQIMTLYFDRQARSVGQQRHRWWLYTLEASGYRSSNLILLLTGSQHGS